MFIYHLRSTNTANAFKTYVLIVTVFPSSVNTYFNFIILYYVLIISAKHYKYQYVQYVKTN